MLLDFHQTEKILSKYKIPFVKSFLAKNANEAIKNAEAIGYPVVLKVVSSDILHRTEIGAVLNDIRNEKELKSGFFKIEKSIKKNAPKAKIEGILVQEQKSGMQIIIGAKIDEVFGPVLMFGLGGIFVEALEDVSFRLAPVTQKDAKEMIKEIKGFKILTGFRGQKKANLRKIQEILLRTSLLIMEENIKEFDLNPIITNEKGAWACDAKIIL